MIRRIIVFCFILSCIIISCKSTEQITYGYEYGNPLVMSENELKDAINKVNNGDPSYCNLISIHYESLEEPNIPLTIYWLTIGAERGDLVSMYNLGFCLYTHLNEKELGLNWIKKAADLGEEFAINFLKNE